MAALHLCAHHRLFVMLAMSLACRSGLGAADLFDTPLVGDLGALAAVDFTGNRTFTADAIRTSLRSDLRVWLAGQPRAPRDEFLGVLAARLVVGYRHHGFAQATVLTGTGTGRLTVSIDEGPRFHCGAIQVRGNQRVSSAAIVRDLTTATPRALRRTAEGVGESPASEAAWTTGEPFPGDDEALAQYQRVVEGTYRAAGHYQARLVVRPLLSAGAPSDLLVDVLDEGPAATVGELVITGLVRAPRAALEAVLGLAPGQPLSPEVVDAAEERLRACGRLVSHDLAIAPAGPPGAQRVTLTVLEAQDLPPLGQPLEEADAALLRVGAWTVAEFTAGRRDLVFDVAAPQGWSLRVAIAHHAGIFLRLRRRLPSGADETLWLWERAHEVALASSIVGRGVRMPGGPRFWSGIVIKADAPKPDSPQHDRADLQFQSGWTASDPQRPATEAMFVVDPIGLMVAFHGAGYRSTLAAGRLEVANESRTAHLAARAETGELEEVSFSAESGTPGAAVTVTPVAGAVEHEIAQAVAAPGLAWSVEDKAPWSSVADLLLRDWAGRAPGAVPDAGFAPLVAFLDGCGDARALLVDGALRPWETARAAPPDGVVRAGADHGHDQEDCICIPASHGGLNPIAFVLATFGVELDLRLGEALPASSWPRALLRGGIGVAVGDTRYLLDDLRHADDPPGVGPLGCLALAGGLKVLGNPLRQALADLGRERLGPAGLVGDLALFDAWAPGLVATIAGWQPPPPWFAELSTRQRQGVDGAIAVVRAGRAAGHADAAIMHALGQQQWEAGLATLVRRALDALAPPPALAPAPPSGGADALP